MNKKYQQSKFIISLILLTISLTLILAFNSYWQYGIEDQSEIIGKIKNYENTNNILGGFGALTSSFFIRLFGVGAYLIPSFIILFSLKIWLKIKRINLLNLFPQHIFFILWIPLFFSSVNNKLLSGKIGLVLSEKLTILIGQVGVIITLLISIIIFIVLTFDIDTKKIFNNIKVLKQFLKTKKEIINNTKTKNDIKKIREDENVKEEEKKDEKLEEELIVDIPDGDKKVNENIINQEDNIISYEFPKLDLLKEYENKISIDDEELEANKRLIEATLKEFKIDVTVERATVGPTITLYEIVPDEGVRIAKIKNLENDIALRIKAVGVRIIAPLPGKGTVGIEVPNQNPTTVSMKDVISSETFQKSDFELPIALGKTISNETFVMDLVKAPHLLIAGATGQGKSVGLNAILCSILFKKHPDEVKFILVDPKKVELTLYNRIQTHFLANLNHTDSIITDTKSVINTLKSLCLEMDKRYDLLKKAEVRNIQEYNQKFKTNKLDKINGHQFLPYLILVIDEFADLIMTAGKEIEIPIARLAQLARAIGIHLIIATQRPTTNIITGTIKANFPTRIAFRVITGIDSKTILDTVGANQLIGRGDMLISTGSSLSRIQCAFIDTPEVEQLTTFIGNQKINSTSFELPLEKVMDNESKLDTTNEERDPLFREAALLVIINQQGSTSMIQRKLQLGYNRAGRIMDQLEATGIVGPLEGSKGRKVLIENEDELNQII